VTHWGRSPRAETSICGRKTKTVTDLLLEAQCEQARALETPGDVGGGSVGGIPPICEFYLQEHYQLLTVRISEKFPHASNKRRETETI